MCIRDSQCTDWKMKFSFEGIILTQKPYMYCRGDNATDIWIDEGKTPPSPRGSTFRLASWWMDGMLVCTFKYKGVQLSDTMRLSADGSTLTEEMITFTDPSAPDPGRVVDTQPLDLDRFIFRRAEALLNATSTGSPTPS